MTEKKSTSSIPDEFSFKSLDWESTSAITKKLETMILDAEKMSPKWIAWQKLKSVDEFGIEKISPYHKDAIETLEAYLSIDQDDPDAIHHLAIAYHAMAWDLELADSSPAFDCWKKALFFWRKLQNNRHFWIKLKNEIKSLDKEADHSSVEFFRKNLLNQLLEVHAEFIQHYYETKQYDRAGNHIKLIRQARISPADKKKLTQFVYEALASSVPKIVHEGKYSAGLDIIDRFLSLFPNYIPALQTYLETARLWLEQLSPSKNYSDIDHIEKRVLSRWESLNTSDDLRRYPSAQAELVNLAAMMGNKYCLIAEILQRKDNEISRSTEMLNSKEYHAHEKAVHWLEKSVRSSLISTDTQLRYLHSLMAFAGYIANIALHSEKTDETDSYLSKALSYCEQAMEVEPKNTAPRQLKAQILAARATQIVNSIESDTTQEEIEKHFENAEKDLTKAIELDPENQSFKGLLEQVLEIK